LSTLSTLEAITNIYYNFSKSEGEFPQKIELKILSLLAKFSSPYLLKFVPVSGIEKKNATEKQAFSKDTIFDANAKKIVYRILSYLIGTCRNRAMPLPPRDKKDKNIFDSSRLIFSPNFSRSAYNIYQDTIINKVMQEPQKPQLPPLSVLTNCLKYCVECLKEVLEEDRIALETISKKYALSSGVS